MPIRDPRHRARLLALFLTLAAAGCIEDASPGTETADAGPDAADPVGPDPDHRRACQPRDIDCDVEQCYGAETEEGAAGCFQPCTPESVDLIGAPDDECAEPERPYCSKLGLWLGGDYSCNGCAFVCTAIPEVACSADLQTCR